MRKIAFSVLMAFTLLVINSAVALNSLSYKVTINSHGIIEVCREYYINKNGTTYSLINMADNSIVKEDTNFANLVNYALSLLKGVGGGTLYIGEGLHVASSPIILASNIKLMGIVEDPTKIIIEQGNSQIWYPGVISMVDVSNVEIAYLTIDMALSPRVNGSSWPPKGNGITFRNDNNDKGNIYIHDVKVLNAGCYGIKTHFGHNITINDVYVEGPWWDCLNIESTNVTIRNVVGINWGDVGIAMFDASEVLVENCTLYDGMEPPGGGSSGVFGFTIEGYSGSEQVIVRDVTVRNVQYGFAVYAGARNTITNCTIENTENMVLGGDENIVINCSILKGMLEIRGVGNRVLNSTFTEAGIGLQSNPDDFQIMGNEIVNAYKGIWFLSNSNNGLIQENHIYSNTTPPSTVYAIDFGWRIRNENITVIYNDFTYNDVPNFATGVLNLEDSENINLVIENNKGYS